MADVLMERDGAQTLVRDNDSVAIMEGLGWTAVRAEPAPRNLADVGGEYTPLAAIVIDDEPTTISNRLSDSADPPTIPTRRRRRG